ncbi:acetylornithine transaminase [Nocardioides yefusunii]|uniref:Acetylornithine aminotransferase n=1 Tax=Nocardioides yefusunii TaxID=2500546 RepID=A0ABW1QWV1_9ACTN|nr:acetylornithine transaminase [Nocardioides yefusunii]
MSALADTVADTAAWQDRYTGSVMNTFGVPQLVLARGEGSKVYDVEGREFLDLLGGIAVNALGHGHPALVAAVTRQVSELAHVSNFFATAPQVELASKLVELFGHDARVFFSNSGTEANEAALKVTRRTGRTKVVAMEHAFHGRTLGALSLTAKEAYRAPFEPLGGEVVWVPFGDVEALAAAVDENTAAVVLEPVQGEAGVNLAARDYLLKVREITTAAGALMWLDEIQTGIGRTGSWFAFQDSDLFDGDVVPDLVTLAKGLGGGVPIGATIAAGPAATLLVPGNHGTTFGGNPLATAAAGAVIATIESEGLLAHVKQVSKVLADGLAADARVTEVRAAGLLIGLDLVDGLDSAKVMQAALAAGYIVNAPTPSRIRLAPPLVLTTDEAEQFLADWPSVLDAAAGA